MNPPLTHVELRILGSLIEKAATVPDSYPLTLSGLVAACNQLTNREPVMQLDEDTVTSAIVTLRRRSLLRAIQPVGSRVTKYLHLLDEALDLDARELAPLAVMMLRGPQTVAELHTRTARLANWDEGPSLDQVLEALLTRDSGSLVTRLARQPGQKEVRYAQLLGGPISETPAAASQTESTAPAPTAERLALEARIHTLEEEVATLKADLAAFKAQFS